MSLGDADSSYDCKKRASSKGLRKSEYSYHLAPNVYVGQQDFREGLLGLWSKQ